MDTPENLADNKSAVAPYATPLMAPPFATTEALAPEPVLALPVPTLRALIKALDGRKLVKITAGHSYEQYRIDWNPRIHGDSFVLDISVSRDGYKSDSRIASLPLQVLVAYTKILENFEAWKTGKVDWPKLVD